MPDTTPSDPAKRFRVAFSFAGEKREFVEKTARILAARFGEAAILYDKYHEAEFARHDLGIYLPKLYGQQCDLIVPVLCARYDAKRWTGWEWMHIYGLLTKADGFRVMPSRFEFAEADGLAPTAGFIDLDQKTPEQFATLILERLAVNEGKPKDTYTRPPSSPPAALNTDIPHNLPALQPFFGREDELRRVADALDPDSRTWGALIDGPGGMGKTSLAVRAAYDASPDLFARILFVSLKTRELDDDGLRDLSGFLISGLAELLNELARELRRDDIAKAPEDQRPRLLLEALRGARALLVLDNLESLLKPERDTLFTFLDRLPPDCKAILTARGRIGTGAKELILEKLSQDAALATLAELATRNPALAQTSEAERIVLYRETAGKPLLLRWTAGQIGRGHCLTFTDAIAYLRSCPAKNDPLEFIFGDLVEDLTPAEMQAISALTYFTLPARPEHIAACSDISSSRPDDTTPCSSGPLGRSNATATGNANDDPDPEAAQRAAATHLREIELALRSLVNRSLATADLDQKTFALVPMVADFLRKARPEVLAETGDRLEKHAYAMVIENGFDEHDRFPVLDASWPTVAAAMPRFLAGPNDWLQIICEALQTFLDFTGRWDEWLALSHDAENRAVAAEDFFAAGCQAYNAGYVHNLRGQSAKVLACADRAEAHWREANAEAKDRAYAILLRGAGHEQAGNYPAAISAYSEAVELWRTLAHKSLEVAKGLHALAIAEHLSGDVEAAERDCNEALRVFQVFDDHEGIAAATCNLGLVALHRRDWLRSEALTREALTIYEKLGNKEGIADGYENLAKALALQGRKSEALTVARRAVEIFSALGSVKLKKALQTLAECEEGGESGAGGAV